MKRSTNRLVNAFEDAGNRTLTENGALTNRTTFSNVLDFFYHAPARRGQDNTVLFADAFAEEPALALKALFYLRDIRQGKGERDTFRQILRWLAKKQPHLFDALVDYVPEYGRWDDLTEMFVGYRSVESLVKKTLKEDMNSENVTLLGKWMPSANAGKASRKLALRWISSLGLTERMYRKILTRLRGIIDIPETAMSEGNWDEIDYAKVPARAMKLYARAFSRHDGTRFGKYLEKAIKGDVVIKSEGIYPHELTYQVRAGNYSRAIEAQWAQLKDYFGENTGNVLVVVDTSGSMFSNISTKSRVQAIDVSVGLGLYCAEHNKGAFAGYVLTFNSDSRLAKIEGRNLQEKMQKIQKLDWGGSTNLQSAFNNILSLANRYGVPQEDMPTNVVVISDMEFNTATYANRTNLEVIRSKYASNGYDMPKLTFWNVQSRHDQTPATKDENGVFLVSGFSAETIGKVLNAKAVNPEELMLETLNSERYSFVDDLFTAE